MRLHYHYLTLEQRDALEARLRATSPDERRLQAALQHHRLLLKNPDLAKRHEVDASASEAGVMDGVLAKLKGIKRLWASS